MIHQDARSLSPSAQDALRKRAVRAHIVEGMKQKDVAKIFGVSPEIVCKWVRRYRSEGESALDARTKGRRPGVGRLLSAEQEWSIRKLIIDKNPDQLKLAFALWTRDAIRELIFQRTGIRIAVRTAGTYLASWGFTPQRPARRAYEKDDYAVQEWLDVEYPSIAKRAKEENARIYWGDEMGLRSDHHSGRSYGLRGRTPVIDVSGKRFKCSMISAVTNLGQLCFRVFDEAFTVKVFIDFMNRLIKQAKRKVFLIVDSHPVHRAKLVQNWREKHKDELELFYLPGYSPELNPDELLNQDVKANVFASGRPRNANEMKSGLRSHLFSTQKMPHIVRNFFLKEEVSYALPYAT